MSEKPKTLFIDSRDSMSDFFTRIDEYGGWPPEAKSVCSVHGFTPYECYFSKAEYVRDEMNSSRYTADDYYLWKLSEKALERVRQEGVSRALRAVQNLTA